jgi:multicomponent Na+:H+ antiporter subunit A
MTQIGVVPIVVLPIGILLIAVVLQVALSRLLSGAAKGALALGATVLSGAAVVMMWPSILAGSPLEARLGQWDGPVALAFHVDGLSLLFALMATSIGAAILLYSISYMAKDIAATRFYIIMQIFIAGLILLVFAADLLVMYAGWEIVGLCSFLLVSFWYTDNEAAAGARKVLVITHIAGYALLAAILMLFARTGTTLWTDPRISAAFTDVIFALMLVSAIAKSVQFPLHTWIPSAMAAPTPVSALLHAAVYVKAGVYLVARMHSFAPWPVSWQVTVVWVGTVTMVVGVLFAMVQHDAKRLLAFHTVSQIGYMMMGLGLGTPLGVAAALLHTFNHGLFKGGLFLGAGAIQHATGTRDMDRLGGLARKMPTTTVMWMISAAGIAGVPLFNGFVSKLLLYIAALEAGFAVPALIAWVVSVLTMFSFMKATSATFFGEEGEASGAAHESPRLMLIGSGILAAGCVLFGVAPQYPMTYMIDPALAALGLHGDLGVGWFGLTGDGGLIVVVGLALAVLSVVVGLVVYQRVVARAATATAQPAATTWVSRELVSVGPGATAFGPVGLAPGSLAPDAPFTGGEPLAGHSYPRASDFSEPVAVGLAPFYAWADPDRYLLGIYHATLRVGALLERASRWLERRMVTFLVAFAVLIGVVAGFVSGVVRGEVAAAEPVIAWPLVVAIGIAGAAMMLVLAAQRDARSRVWWTVLIAALVISGLTVSGELARVVLLEGAAFGVVAMLAATAADRRATRAYLTAAVLSAVALVGATLLMETAPASWVLALFLVGFSIKLALVPAYLWLPVFAERVPAAVVGLVVGVVDVAAFGELIDVRQRAPWLFAPEWPWLVIALASAFVGALLALAQQDVKRMLAASTITGAGFIVLGITVAGPFGIAGAMAGAAADALSKSLLFASVAAAERSGGSLNLSMRGVARNHPLALAGFVIGSLATFGVPFTAGFTGHWRLYASALTVGGPVLAVLVAATGLSILAYVRVIALVWWGGSPGQKPVPPDQPRQISVWASEPRPLVVAIAGLLIAVVVAGLVPGLMQEWMIR